MPFRVGRQNAYIILVLLIVPLTIYRCQGASTWVLFGMAWHRPLAIALLIEGVANLALSIMLVRPFGIVGDAVSTAIPLPCTSLLFLPCYLCRLLEVRVRDFIRQAYVLPVALCGPLVAVLLIIRYLFRAHNVAQLLLQIPAGGIACATGLLWFFITREPMGMKLRTRFMEYVQQSLSR